MTLLSIVVMSSFALMGKKENRRPIDELWTRYEKALEEDRVSDMADILEDIKALALKERATLDYFRACDEYVNAKSRRNWKLTDTLTAQASRELHDYGLPSLEILFGLRHGDSSTEMNERFMQDADAMKKSKNPDLYAFYGDGMFRPNDASAFNRMMVNAIDNDYEFVLWSILEDRGYHYEWAYNELLNCLGGAYPAVPYMRFMNLKFENDQDVREAELKKMMQEYAGRGMGIVAEDEILRLRFSDTDEKTTSDEFRKLEKDIVAFEARKKALKGEEASIAEIAENAARALETLREKSAAVVIKDGNARLMLRNLDKARFVILKDKKPVYETVAVNEDKSFYKIDTLKIDIPDIDDGDYTVAVYDGTKELLMHSYDKHTVSVAKRFAADGMCIYAADYLTGKPVEKADLLIHDSNMNLLTVVEDFIFDGFTPLPEDVYPFKDGKGRFLVCRYEDEGLVHLSEQFYMNNGELKQRRTKSQLWAKVVTDRAAYVPGDTVRFKVFMYEEYPDGTGKAMPEGEEVVVAIEDPEGNETLTTLPATNEFGSSSGTYVIRDGVRNGSWKIYAPCGRCSSEYTYFVVDEFVLPSYDLNFHNPDKLYFPGDEITVAGKVTSYSGHGLNGLRATAFISINYKLAEEKPVVISPDGTFEVSFVAGGADDDFVSYGVEIRLTDRTGETLEFNWNSDARKSISLGACLVNRDNGRFSLTHADRQGYRGYINISNDGILSAGTAEIKCSVSDRGVEIPGFPFEYDVVCEGRTVAGGKAKSGDTVKLDMSGLPSGLYSFVMKASAAAADGDEIKSSYTLNVLYVRENDKVMPEGARSMFRTSYEDGQISMQFGSGNGPVWAVVELFGEGRVLLEKRMLYVNGKAGENGSLETLVFPHSAEYSDALFLSLFYFKDGEKFSYTETFERPETGYEMPLEFVSFADSALPGQEVSLKMRTSPDAEVLVSVFDASSQKIAVNRWGKMKHDYRSGSAAVSYSYREGSDECKADIYVVAYGTGRKKASVVGGNSAMRTMTDAAVEEAAPFQMAKTSASFMDVSVRDDFATTLAFEPFLRPSSDGMVEMKFRTSDKLSTFIVKALAHDRAMNGAIADREMLVTLPVKVSVAAPQYLHAGDKYVLNASVSNTSSAAVKGTVRLEVFDGEKYEGVEPLKIDSSEVEVPAGGSASAVFEIAVPEEAESLGFKVVFAGYELPADGAAANDVLISDGMFVPLPVYPAAQTLTEAHSTVVLAGESAEEAVERLRRGFVNVSSAGAEYSEVSIMDMIHEALPVAYKVEDTDAVSLSKAMYVNLLAAGLRYGSDEMNECVAAAMEAISKLLKCANPDGGFGWFEGMSSTPIITTVVLDRYARLRDAELLQVVSDLMGEDALDDLDAAVAAAVKYLDMSYFKNEGLTFRYAGSMSLEQYLGVRSKFAGIPFDEAAAEELAGKDVFKSFRKTVGRILGSTRMSELFDDKWPLSWKLGRITAVVNLTASDEGLDLAKALGAPSERKMKKSLKEDLESLKQYAVEHSPGVYYYPNAVMPWRGLLETEAYMHAVIADIALDQAVSEKDSEWAAIARGLRVWMMLQKETQEWSSDPGFVDALASVMNDCPDVRIVVMKKRYSKPFDEIKAAGNGFKVSVDYYKADADGSRVRLADGDSLHVGDKITAVYSLWSEENRSFVRLSVPRAACFRPARQLSGYEGGWFRPVGYGSRMLAPYSYREVKADRTLWWIDVFPEEKSSVEEELFVTQEGVFTAPVAEIECLYAPHYRANDGFGGQAAVRRNCI